MYIYSVFSDGTEIQAGEMVEYECFPGYTRPDLNELTCTGGRLVPGNPTCAESVSLGQLQPSQWSQVISRET